MYTHSLCKAYELINRDRFQSIILLMSYDTTPNNLLVSGRLGFIKYTLMVA